MVYLATYRFAYLDLIIIHSGKVQVGNGQEKAQSERNSHPKNRGAKKLQLGTYTYRTYRKPSEQLFPIRRPLNYPNFTKTMKTYMAAPVAERLRALSLNHSIISPLCLVWVRAPLWPHVRQAKFCLRVCQVVLPFSPHLLIGPSHMS